ncbi:MAG: S8 family serine peptidase, partial [Alphaproteobacteria bacterium]|nr:S8 family serine peptidase [Alphaproteobacteria bacterium]
MKKQLLLLSFLIITTPILARDYATYQGIMDAVETRDLKVLKKLVSAGENINMPGPNGQTPLCTSVAQGDYEGYELLLSQGASPYVACMQELPAETVQNFYANQPPAHSYYVGYGAAARSVNSSGTPFLQNISFPTLGAGEALLAAGIAGAVIAFGHGSGGDDDPKNTYSWDAPLNLNPTTFSNTAEYQSSNVNGLGTKGMNYLGAIKAADAYARGYTGYKIKRDAATGALSGKGEEAISEEKVKVAVVDSGVYDHTELSSNISLPSGGRYNFVYGVCSGNNTERCWKYNESEGIAYLYENYDPSGTNDAIESFNVSKAVWDAYALKYGSYQYNKTDVTPLSFQKWTTELMPGNKSWIAYSTTETVEPEDPEDDPETLTRWYMYVESAIPGYNFTPGESYEIACEAGSSNCATGVATDDNDNSIIVSRSTDRDTHGTAVAGLIGASKSDSGSEGMMGVAYNAEIIPFKTDFDIQLMEAFPKAVAAADIINLSIQAPTDGLGVRYASAAEAAEVFNAYISMPEHRYMRAGYQTAAASNKILVFSAGNYTHGSAEPYDSSLLSMAPLSSSFNSGTYNLTNLFVNVVSVVPNGSGYTLADYSAKCGVTKNYCIAAPGGSSANPIYSTGYNDGYVAEAGTSFAAPIVSGALAVIKGAFPHLTNQQVVQILFETATDLGAKGVDDVYGHGLVNLEAATSPIGLTKINLTKQTNGASVPTTSSSASVPSSMAAVANALPERVLVLDKYDRGFQMATSSFVHVAKRENKLDGRFKSFMSGNGHVIKPTDMFEMSYSERRSNRYSDIKQGSVSVLFRPTETMAFQTFYSEDTQTSGGSYFDRIMMSPYAKMKEAWGANMTFKLGQNWQASIMGQVGQNGFVNEDELRKMDHNKVSLFQSTLQYNGL